MTVPGRTRIFAAVTGLCLAGAATALLLSASRLNPDAVPSSQAVAGRVMSPFCPGLTLEECPSSEGAQLRQKIDRRIASGATNRQIDSWLVREYGESVLAKPPGALSWAVPAALVLLGLVSLLFILSGRAKPPVPEPDPDPLSGSGDPAERSRMLEDLGRFAQGTE